MQKPLIIITPKYIQRIKGYSYKTSARVYRQIRDDFCAFTSLTRENVDALLQE